jgi:para-nitrobenzyl esterase
MMFTREASAVMEADPWNDRLDTDRLDLVEQAADVQSASAASNLGGTFWQLVQFQSDDGTTLTPKDSTRYTIAFTAEGQMHVRVDCNRGRGTWTSTDPNQLVFGPIALTRAMCPPSTLYDRVVQDLPLVRSYVLQDGRLFLSLLSDGGIYEFEPMSNP